MGFDWAPITAGPSFLSQRQKLTFSARAIFSGSPIVFNLGGSDISVTNMSPRDGAMDFMLCSQWNLPLNIVVDTTVFDPPEEFRLLFMPIAGAVRESFASARTKRCCHVADQQKPASEIVKDKLLWIASLQSVDFESD